MIDHNNREQREKEAIEKQEAEIEAEKTRAQMTGKLDPHKEEVRKKKEELNQCIALLTRARNRCEDLLPHLKTLEEVKEKLFKANRKLLSLPEGFSFSLFSPLFFFSFFFQ